MRHLLLLTLAAACAAAQTAPTPPRVPRNPTFVLPEQLDASSFLPGPPADPAKDMAELLRVQASRTPEQVAQAKADDAEESIFIYADILGEKFNRAALPLTALFSDHVRYDVSPIINGAKRNFRRPRPYHFSTEIHPVCKASAPSAAATDFAYPSGHAGVGYIEALVLAQMVPEKRVEILARAETYAYNRVVCGVHYPTDLPGSKAVAYSLMGVFLNNPFFKKEMAAAKAELRTALGLPH